MQRDGTKLRINSTDTSNMPLERLFMSRLIDCEPYNVNASTFEFVRLLRAGMKGSAVRDMATRIPPSLLAKVLGVKPSSITSVAKRATLSSQQTEELNHFTEIWFELRAFFQFNNDHMLQWINSSLPILDGGRPADILGSHYGREAVAELLSVMRYGDL